MAAEKPLEESLKERRSPSTISFTFAVIRSRRAKSSWNRGKRVTKNAAETICTSGLSKVEVVPVPKVPLVFNSFWPKTQRPATKKPLLRRIYQRLRPGNPPQLEKARTLSSSKSFSTSSIVYRLGRSWSFPYESEAQTAHRFRKGNDAYGLRGFDFLDRLRHFVGCRWGTKAAVRSMTLIISVIVVSASIDELASDELRKGFLA